MPHSTAHTEAGTVTIINTLNKGQWMNSACEVSPCSRFGSVRLLIICALLTLLFPMNSRAQLTLRSDLQIPEVPGFRALPKPDDAFTSAVQEIVRAAGLEEHTPAKDSADSKEEWASICVVDLTVPEKPVVGGWQECNFVYPASAYKMYVLGEAVRQVCTGKCKLDDMTTVAKHNDRGSSRLTAEQVVPLSEILRLMCTYSDNTAANVAIDVVDRQCASALLRAMGCTGSDITRKFLSRTLEDDGYSSVPGTLSSAHHFATFLYAVETGCIGGGLGRGLIKGYLSTGGRNMRNGLPDTATLYSKPGWWSSYTSEAALIEDGSARYISCVLTAMPEKKAAPRMVEFTRRLNALMKERAGDTTGKTKPIDRQTTLSITWSK
jgi:Beta-lactamase enzyme family